MPVPEQHYKIAQQLYQRRSGITVRELAQAVTLDQGLVLNGLHYLEQKGLAVCHGRGTAAHWAASEGLRFKGPTAAADGTGDHRRKRQRASKK